jgi:hypothetical protein
MGDRSTSAGAEIRSWAALGLAVVSVVGVLWGRRTGVISLIKDPITHKIVCSCRCGEYNAQGEFAAWETQTFAERTNCGDLNDIRCKSKSGRVGVLGRCLKESVPVGRQRPEGVRPVIKG